MANNGTSNTGGKRDFGLSSTIHTTGNFILNPGRAFSIGFWFNGTINSTSPSSILEIKKGGNLILDVRRSGTGLFVQTVNMSESMTIANVFSGISDNIDNTYFGFSIGSLGNMN